MVFWCFFFSSWRRLVAWLAPLDIMVGLKTRNDLRAPSFIHEFLLWGLVSLSGNAREKFRFLSYTVYWYDHPQKKTNKSSSERKIEARNTVWGSCLTTFGDGLMVWNEVAVHNGGVCSYDERRPPRLKKARYGLKEKTEEVFLKNIIWKEPSEKLRILFYFAKVPLINVKDLFNISSKGIIRHHM